MSIHVNVDSASATPVLAPDREALAAFSAAIFKNANPKGFVSLRAFKDDGKDGPAIFIEPISVGNPDYLDVVVERVRQAAEWTVPAVFCPPVSTFLSGKGAKTEDICEGLTLSVDCDASPAAARGALGAIIGKPTIAVASGGEWTNPDTGEVERKCHLHWRLKEPTKTTADHELLKEARQLATALVGGDATGVSLVHPFRWPGSWHRKAQPKLAEIIESNDVEIDLHEAIVVLREAAGRRETTADGFAEAATRKQLASNPEHVALALREIPNEKREWSEWNYFGLAIWGATGGSEVGFNAFAEWSAKSSKNDPAKTKERWDHYKTSPPGSLGFGTLVYYARKSKPGWTTEAAGAPCKLPYGYSFSDRGLMWKDPDDVDKPALHVAGCFDIEAMTRNGDGNGWGLLLRWKDHDGRDHRFALVHELLAGDGLEARRILTSQGFYIAPNPAARSKFNAFLLQVTSPNRALSTESVGWNGDAFVLPDDCIGGNWRDAFAAECDTRSFVQAVRNARGVATAGSAPRCRQQPTRVCNVHGLRWPLARTVF
jgi:hypothetical protein